MTLPAPLRQSIELLRHQSPLEVSELRQRVSAHLEKVRQAARSSAFIDLERAELVARQCLALLDHYDAMDAEQRGWVQAGCLYFVQTEDGEDDFDSIIGFDDDADVLAFVLDRLGRTDLVDLLES